VSVAATYERLRADARLAQVSDVAKVVLATAWADGAPLYPLSVAADAEVLVVAELHVRHGVHTRIALARARAEDIDDATLRGAVRRAASRLAQDRLGGELLHRGISSVRDLTRAQAVELALRLNTLPADEPEEEGAFIDALAELGGPEPEPEFCGEALGPCVACGNPVGDADGTIGVHYYVAARRRKDGTLSDGRHEWRTFSPATERRSELLRQAHAGADLLCLPCAIRARYGLIEWPTSRTTSRPPDPVVGAERRS
jgi:hypothetical protein